MKVTDKQHALIRSLRAKGVSLSSICQATGLRETAVLKYSKVPLSGEASDGSLRRELREARRQLEDALAKEVVNATYQDFVSQVVSRPVRVPDWTFRSDGKRAKAIPTAFLSDTHFDEVVDPRQINHVNGFNRAIGEARLKQFFFNATELSRKFVSGIDYPGFCMPMGGDIFSGAIHEELARTNVATMCASVLHWLEPVAAGIKMLAGEFGRVIIPCAVGNHPRNTRKPIHKGRVEDNFDWLFCQFLRKMFQGDTRVEFIIGESADVAYSLFNTRFNLTHGDQFSGGGGVAGLFSPLMLGDHRKRQRQQAVKQPYDVLLMGHWHQLLFMGGRVIVNGSLKGYDEYAFHNNLPFEKPRQAWFLTDPKYGVTLTAPIHVSDNEDWGPPAHFRLKRG